MIDPQTLKLFGFAVAAAVAIIAVRALDEAFRKFVHKKTGQKVSEDALILAGYAIVLFGVVYLIVRYTKSDKVKNPEPL